jgi:dCTP deaminase
MLLSDHDIRAELTAGRIQLSPCDYSRIQPSSIDVCLGPEFLVYHPGVVVDPKTDQATLMHRIALAEDASFVLPPHGFALGATRERVTMPNDLAARFEGKSSIGRLGLLPHVAAGFIDPGFSGWITLELHNVTDKSLVLYPGMPVGQLCFFRLSSPADVPYGSTEIGSKYQGQTGPTPSRFHLNYKESSRSWG